MSRIRQIKPSWFTDKAIQTGLRADAREFYIGLWMLADDDGWFEWDRDGIGVFVYGFLPLGRRETLIARQSLALMELDPEAPHLVIYPCGHAQVPKMPQHQRVSDAKRVTVDHRRHVEGKCPRGAAGSRGEPRASGGVLPRGEPRGAAEPPPGNGKELVGNGTGSARASANGAKSGSGALLADMAAHGLGVPEEVAR